MAQGNDIVAALKSELRRAGLTYAQVARELELSESSIKRMFAGANFTLRRLQQVCDLIGIEVSDLAALADERHRDVEELSEAQEQELVSETKLLMVAFLLHTHWTVDKILAVYDIAPLEMVQLLAKLDRLKIIDLLAGNKVRMRLSRTFSWRANGPIQRMFEDQVQQEFFQSHFDGPGELRLVLNGAISDQSIAIMHQRMQRLLAEFEACVREDRKSFSTERMGTTLYMAIRPWALQMFEAYRKVPAA